MKRVRVIFGLVLVLIMVSGTVGIQSQVTQSRYAAMRGQVLANDGSPIPGVLVTLTGKNIVKETSVTDEKGIFFFVNLPAGEYQLKCELEGFNTVIRKGLRLKAGETFKLSVVLLVSSLKEEVIVSGNVSPYRFRRSSTRHSISSIIIGDSVDFNTEEYARVYENVFKNTVDNPLSTFSIDVDTASYANTRRFIKDNQLPPKDAVRVEELINYFTYDYPQPKNDHPFSITGEVSQCPWNSKHLLVHLGLQGKKMKRENRAASNLVFLLDVSGSMDMPNKLPLLKSAFKLLVDQLEPEGRVAIVVYAGAAGVVLPSTSGNRKQTIIEAIDRLYAGGSTAGGEGIRLAYKIAEENFIKEGNNRIILATDGDFNIGVSSTSELVRLVEKKRETGVFLTVLGFGMGNYKDNRMEQLADKGNGNYFYIDGLLEAKKVLADEIGGTLFTIAKDVKIQVEFNPAKVKAYKLVGYENRKLDNEDFDDDVKDAGELGAGHSVTILYEIVPASSKEHVPGLKPLKYQRFKIKAGAYGSNEIMTVKLRYKPPKGKKSKLIEVPVKDQQLAANKTTDNFRFSAAVAEWALLLRNSKFKGSASFDHVLALGKSAKGTDDSGYRSEFLQLVELSSILSKSIARR